MGEIVAVVLGLKTNQIVIGEAAENVFVMRQRLQDVRRRARDVQVKADRIEPSARAQFSRQRHQVVVVHPDDVVVLDEEVERVGEATIDAHVAAPVGARIFLQIDAIVKDRPKHPVRQSLVIFLEIDVREVDDGVGDAIALQEARLRRRFVGDVAAPTEPDARSVSQRRFHGDRQAAGHRLLAFGGERDTVRYDDQAHVHASCQLNDSLVAVLMIPAIE